MLPLKNRLKKENDFQAVLRKGKRVQKEGIALKVLENNKKESRFGFVVSKKVAKKAVARNILRRRLSEASRLDIIPNLKKSVDAVVILRPDNNLNSFSALRQELKRLFSKAGLI